MDQADPPIDHNSWRKRKGRYRPKKREQETMIMLTIFWTAYTPFVVLLLSLIGSFMMDKMRRLSAQLSFAPARGQQRFPRDKM
jgi:hypothetical protein